MSIFTFISRRLRRTVDRKRRYPGNPPPPAGFIATRAHRHKFKSRRPAWFFFRPHKKYVIPAKPSGLAWKRFKAPRIKRGNWPILRQRWRHVIFPPVKPAGFIPRQSRYLLQMRVRRRKFWRQRPRRYSFPGAAAPNVMVLQRVWRVYLTRPAR